MGFALAEAISLPPDFTKPISRRPREMTSAVAYSSATRTGSCRSEISVPSVRMRTCRVCRARIPRSIGLDASSELMPAWCSMASTLMPEIVAEQELVDAPPRTGRRRSSGRSTGWAGWPARNPSRRGHPGGRTGTAPRTATKRPSRLSRRSLNGQRARKRAIVSAKVSACSISGWCPAPAISSKRAPGMQLGVGAAIGGRHEAVARPPHHQRRDA